MERKRPFSHVPKPLRIVMITIFGVLAGCAFALLFGLFVMLLWNWLMPSLFALPEITYLQAAGIVLLARMVFGFGGGLNGSDKDHKRCDEEDWHEGWREGWHEDWHWHEYNIRQGHRGWRYYDAWWSEEGKAAFEQFIDKMESNPAPEKEQED